MPKGPSYRTLCDPFAETRRVESGKLQSINVTEHPEHPKEEDDDTDTSAAKLRTEEIDSGKFESMRLPPNTTPPEEISPLYRRFLESFADPHMFEY